jgi:hypothetical protein
MTARKSTSAKATPKKTTAKTATAKKASPKKASATKEAAKKTATQAGPKSAEKIETKAQPKPAKKAAGKGFSAAAVHLGHVFALRPRVETSFEPGHFQTAKVLLVGEHFADLKSAARAVAEKALKLTHKGGSKKGRRGSDRLS